MLWFKNLMVYRLSREVALNADEMEKQLSAFAFTPCGSQDMAKTGWVSPMGSHSESLTHAVNGQIVICARKEEKSCRRRSSNKSCRPRLNAWKANSTAS